MTKRKRISKGKRFEIFKRDRFTCQYCGKAAPDVVLHIDHIHPISEGGTDDILNLVTSCRDCNLGKSNRLLSDDAAIKQRKRQLDEFQDRREQLEMLLEWHRSLLDIESDALCMAAKFWDEIIPGFCANETGEKKLKSWIKEFGLNEILEAMKIAADRYSVSETDSEEPTLASVNVAFNKIPGICFNRRRYRDKPHLKDLAYIAGIARNRFGYYSRQEGMALLEGAFDVGWSIDELKRMTLNIPNWSSWRATLEDWIERGPWREDE